MALPIRGQAYSFDVPLIDAATGQFRANPTLASGDVKVSLDGGAFANIEGGGSLSSYVAVTPASGRLVLVTLDTTQMASGRVAVQFVDQTSPAEWNERIVTVQTIRLLEIEGSVNDASATATSFILSSGFSATDDFYNGMFLVLQSGTLSGLSRRITDYVGATKTVTLDAALPSAPANGALVTILGYGE